jgi:integrase
MDRQIYEFANDWHLSGKAKSTAAHYLKCLEHLLSEYSEPDLASAKAWIESAPTVSVKRKRAQSVRAYGKWATENEYEIFEWWKRIMVPREQIKPQETVTVTDYEKGIAIAANRRDRALIEVLWSCGLRRSEIASLRIEDVNFEEGFVIVRTTKTGKPRVAPLSPPAIRALRRFLGRRNEGSLLQMSSNAIRLRLQRMGLPSAHAWRRGWAVQALRTGVSETSVRAAAGWSSGAMVARYTQALSGELAVEEFRRSWSG